MLVGPGVAEISEYTVAHILGNEAVETGDRLRDAFVISADHRTQILGVEPGRESGRAYEVGEHDRELAAFGFGSLAAGAVGLDRMFGRVVKSLGSQGGDRIEENTAMADR